MKNTDHALDALFDRMEADPEALPVAGTPVPGTLHGMQFIPADAGCIWWASTYDDMAALLEAGYQQTVLLVPGPGRADPYAPLSDHADVLGACPRFVLTGGPDALTRELARRLGRHRAWLARWPAGIDGPANMLREQGEDALREAVAAAEAYPLEGVYRTSAEAMIAYRNRPPPAVLTTGCAATDAIFKFPAEGKIILVTGMPSAGKSTYVRHVMAHMAITHDRKWAVFSPEMGDWEDFAARLTGWFANRPFRQMEDDDVGKWATWMRPRFAFISRDSFDDPPSLDWLLDTIAVSVLRDGITDFFLDPWNQVYHQRPHGMSEVEYIDAALLKIGGFGRRYGCNAWLAVHPTKLRPAKPGDALPVPTAYDMNGGAAWRNKGDIILSVYRIDGKTQIHLEKAKFDRWSTARAGDATATVFAELTYNTATGRFSSLPPGGLPMPPDDVPYDQAPEF